MSAHDSAGSTLINHWQRGVPVYREPVVTPPLLFFGALAVIGLGISMVRLFSPLAPFSGMNDAYAWGLWKTFNVFVLTAPGTGALAIGLGAWVFNRHRLHIVMRTALVAGFMFYFTGLVALFFDVGRPWNFWNMLAPWRWNLHSPMFEVALCMLAYTFIFLLFENVPMVLERFYYTGSERTRNLLRRAAPALRRIYPFMITGAYVLPMMHQSTLGALLLLAGDKIHPLWQSPLMPLTYLLGGVVAGISAVILMLLFACLHYSRPLELDVLGELGNLLSWSAFLFLGVRSFDIVWRGQLGAAFRFDAMSVLFLVEMALVLLPAIALRRRALRETPRPLLVLAMLACLGAMLYRFDPTTVAFTGGAGASYFPSLLEILMTLGFVALAFVGFTLAVKLFAVLPAEADEWHYVFKLARPDRAGVPGGSAP